MDTKHFYNKTTFETRGYESNVNISKYINLQGWTEFTLGQEPQVLLDAMQESKTPAQLLAEKWAIYGSYCASLTVTTDAGNTFAVNREALAAITIRRDSMLDTDSILWVESWGPFQTTRIDLQDAIVKANDLMQAKITELFGGL